MNNHGRGLAESDSEKMRKANEHSFYLQKIMLLKKQLEFIPWPGIRREIEDDILRYTKLLKEKHEVNHE